MSSKANNRLPGFIREDRTFTTPTIVDYDVHSITVSNENFRDAKQLEEYLLFFQHEQMLYYPYATEFRYIENNVLFLLVEYQINSFSMLRRVLNSSYEKEERVEVNIQALIYHTKEKPSFCHPLPHFVIEPEYKTELYEWTQNYTKTS
jgi:hypothetical protein